MYSSNGNKVTKITESKKHYSDDEYFDGNLSKKEQKALKKKRKRESLNKRNQI